MWVDSRSWLKTVVLGGFALPHIWLRTLVVTGLATVVTVLYEKIPELHYSVSPTPFTLIGLPLGIFLGFRNNAAYDRFWEGRKLWGGLVNDARSITRQVLTLISAPSPDAKAEVEEFKQAFVRYIIGYFHAIRHSLRDEKPWETMKAWMPEHEVNKQRGSTNVPISMLHEMSERVLTAHRKKWIETFHVNILETSIVSLCNLQGGAERIKLTPIPFSYTVLLHRIVALYCALLPFGIMEQAKWATPFVVLAVSYCFFGLDAVGDELEQPFGYDVNDLPLNAITRTIERNLRERIAEEVPPPLESKNGILT